MIYWFDATPILTVGLILLGLEILSVWVVGALREFELFL